MNQIFDEKTIRKELRIDAKGLGIPSGAADVFIDKTIMVAKQKIKSKKIITQNDLERIITTELKKYNADFAYVYENRDKII
ncbi:hypothetical protein IKD49_02655 [Candidatus Saccharibacteria bacterium]|nr:hypothetical protein [Candidatus Saccharibacteria bacterium]